LLAARGIIVSHENFAAAGIQIRPALSVPKSYPIIYQILLGNLVWPVQLLPH
jgi:hypothetical protein